jgi:hypothetical protein
MQTTEFTLEPLPSSTEDRRRRLLAMRLRALGPVEARTNVLLVVTTALPHFFSCGRFCFKDTFVITIFLMYQDNMQHAYTLKMH